MKKLAPISQFQGYLRLTELAHRLFGSQAEIICDQGYYWLKILMFNKEFLGITEPCAESNLRKYYEDIVDICQLIDRVTKSFDEDIR